MKSVLMISYSYSPHITPRALRWSAIAEYLVAQGIAVHMVCGWDPGSARTETRNGVRVHRIGSAAIETLRSKLLGRTAFNIDSGPEKRNANPENTANRPVVAGAAKKLAKSIHDITWKKLYWPDYAVLWYRGALKQAKQLVAEGKHDAFVTIAPPFTGHLVGLALKKNFTGIRWIADSGDPFSFAEFSTMNSEILYARLNKYAEGRVCAMADGLCVTTQETAKIYAELFPVCRGKIEVIPPLLNPDCFRYACNRRETRKDGRIRLLYVGNFHRRLREPATYIHTIDRAITCRPALADRLELHFLGDAGLVAESLKAYPSVGDLCTFHGRASRNSVMEAMQQADVFVNIGNATSYQLPSKVIEYASFGKPILNFSSTARDSSAAFLSEYPLFLTVHGEACEQDGRTVAAFLEKNAYRRMTDEEVGAFVRPYTVDRIAGQYLSLMDDRAPNGHEKQASATPETTSIDGRKGVS